MGKVVKVAKAPTSASKPAFKGRELLAQLCYFYPRYSFDQARHLPYWQVAHLLKTARQEQAKKYLELAQIAAAPHTKGGELYKQLVEKYQEQARG